MMNQNFKIHLMDVLLLFIVSFACFFIFELITKVDLSVLNVFALSLYFSIPSFLLLISIVLFELYKVKHGVKVYPWLRIKLYVFFCLFMFIIFGILAIVYEYYYPYEKIFDWIEFAFALLYECLISFYFIKKFDEDIKEMNEKDKK